MIKLNACILFGGISPEREVSWRSAESALQILIPDKYNIFPAGSSKAGKWTLFACNDYFGHIEGSWIQHSDNCAAVMSHVRGQGLLRFFGDIVTVLYTAIGCNGLSRVDFFVTYEDNRVAFNEINTLPGFTSSSICPKMFAASGIDYDVLLDRLLKPAMEVFV